MKWLLKLFERKRYTTIAEYGVYSNKTDKMIEIVYVLQDQYGHIKEKRIKI